MALSDDDAIPPEQRVPRGFVRAEPEPEQPLLSDRWVAMWADSGEDETALLAREVMRLRALIAKVPHLKLAAQNQPAIVERYVVPMLHDATWCRHFGGACLFDANAAVDRSAARE